MALHIIRWNIKIENCHGYYIIVFLYFYCPFRSVPFIFENILGLYCNKHFETTEEARTKHQQK